MYLSDFVTRLLPLNLLRYRSSFLKKPGEYFMGVFKIDEPTNGNQTLAFLLVLVRGPTFRSKTLVPQGGTGEGSK